MTTVSTNLGLNLPEGTDIFNYDTFLKQNFEKIDKAIHWVDVSKFGYDLTAVKAAVATLKDGDTLYFPNALTSYQILGEAVTISVPNITLKGSGKIIADYGFRPTASGFTADGLRMETPTYSQNARAIQVDIPPSGTFLKNFVVRNCTFKNFFYSANFKGGEYNYTGNEAAEGFPVRDVFLFNNYSETYVDMGGGDGVEKNAGHFNCTQVENVTYAFNKTYGGRNATSYNAIKGNGFIKIIGNYDDSNTYGSCEVENGSGKTVISGNTFKKVIWVDDTANVVIDGNYTSDNIKVTCGSDVGVADNIVITNNTANQIRLESYGYYQGGYSNNVLISGNTLNGTGSYGIYVDGKYSAFSVIDGNMITGTYSSGKIGVVRGSSWATGTAYIEPQLNPDGSVKQQGSVVNNGGNTYLCVSPGTSGATAPTHTSGTASDGGCTWKYLKKTVDCTVKNHIVNGNFVISGSGGKVTSISNVGATFTTTNADDGDTCSTLPTASVSLRGKMILLRKGSGVADELYVCRKHTDDTYVWVKII